MVRAHLCDVPHASIPTRQRAGFTKTVEPARVPAPFALKSHGRIDTVNLTDVLSQTQGRSSQPPWRMAPLLGSLDHNPAWHSDAVSGCHPSHPLFGVSGGRRSLPMTKGHLAARAGCRGRARKVSTLGRYPENDRGEGFPRLAFSSQCGSSAQLTSPPAIVWHHPDRDRLRSERQVFALSW